MNRIKELRKSKGLTQEELADEINVTKLTILRWEKGDRTPKSDKAQQMAEFFGVSVGYLLGYDDRPKVDKIRFYSSAVKEHHISIDDIEDSNLKNAVLDYIQRENIIRAKMHEKSAELKEHAQNNDITEDLNELIDLKLPTEEFLSNLGRVSTLIEFKNELTIDEFSQINAIISACESIIDILRKTNNSINRKLMNDFKTLLNTK